MKAFESTGLWFLPDDPDTQIPGVFTFSDDGKLLLSLSGSFQHTWNLEAARYPIICGSVSESPYGKFITLFDCFATSLRVGMSSAGVEKITANHGFAGTDFVESNEATFDGVNLYFTTLQSWLNISGMKFEHGDNGMGVLWKTPESVECAVADAHISTRFGFTTTGGPMAGVVTLEETPAFSVGQFGSITAQQIHNRFMGPLSYLLTFASDGKDNLERYTLRRSSDKSESSDRFDRLYSPAVKYEEPAKRSRGVDLLFTLKDVSERYEPFMQEWFAFVQSHPHFCTMFFSHGYEKHGFLESRFLFQMLAAECLVREEMTNDDTTKAFEKSHAEMLASTANLPFGSLAIPSALQMAMPAMLAQYLNRHWSLVHELVGTSEARFVESLYATLNYAQTLENRSESVVKGTPMYRLLERLTAVIKICVLKTLEFPDEQIRKIINRNSQMGFIRGLKGPWEPDHDDDDDDDDD
jgi:hypothetical protein